MPKKIKKLEYDRIQIIFTCRESEIYIIVQLPNDKRTYNLIDLIEKYI